MFTEARTNRLSERDRGFAMVALLVGMSVAAIWMMVTLPAWRQQTQRQREEDLIFRGEQYARAIVLYQVKNQGANPPSIDVLVSGHYLRKKWKDPITNEDFVPVGIGIAVGPGQPGQQQTGTAPGRIGAPVVPIGGGQPGVGQQAGITGVRSSSTATSIKIYQNQQQHNLWQFDAALIRGRMGRTLPQQPGRPGGPGREGPGAGQPGRGGQPGVPGRGDRIGGPGRGGPPPPPPPPPGRGRGGF